MKAYLDKIVHLHPDLLLLQVEVVAPSPRPHGYKEFRKDIEKVSKLMRPGVIGGFRKFSKSLRKPLAPLLPGILRPSERKGIRRDTNDDPAPDGAGILSVQQQNPSFGLAEKLEDKLDEFQVGDFSSDPIFEMGRHLIQKALGQGIRVAVVETPLSFSISSRVAGDVFERRASAVRQLFGNFPPVYLRYMRVLPDSYFLDYRHLNAAGRAIFLKWFSQIVVQKNIQHSPCPI